MSVSLSQKIVIFCKTMEWGHCCFKYIISQISREHIRKIKNSKSEIFCELKNGDVIRVIRASDKARGVRCTRAIVQDGVDQEIIDNIIRPCIKVPFDTIRSGEEIVLNYDSIEQQLPRKFKVVIRC